VWFRVGPAAKALIDAAILYLRRGGRIKSPALAEALRKAAEEVLRLTTPIRLLAKAAGYAVARQLGIEVDEEKAIALGIQRLNTPNKRRKDVTTPRDAPAARQRPETEHGNRHHEQTGAPMTSPHPRGIQNSALASTQHGKHHY
jgi:hypothetical protein